MARPRKPLLDRDRIAATALNLVDETGDFTVPEVARRLGVQTASLYHHVDGRSGIVELLRAKIGAELICPPLDGRPWEPAMREFARAYRAAFAAHPHVAPLLMGAPVRAPTVLECYEWMVSLMEQAGLPTSNVMTALTALENFIIGSALDLAAPEEMWVIPPGVEAPRLAAALAAQPATAHRADQAFEFGITILIDGIKKTLQPEPHTQTESS